MSASNCITHSFACDCREAKFKEIEAQLREREAREAISESHRAPMRFTIMIPGDYQVQIDAKGNRIIERVK